MAVATVLFACPGSEGERSIARDTLSSAPPDSLVLTNAAGAEVWFTLAREATGADSHQCVERGLEIRDRGRRVKVPLLYTGVAPVLLDDSTIRAVLWTHCQPGDAYLVNLHTGQPIREHRDDAS